MRLSNALGALALGMLASSFAAASSSAADLVMWERSGGNKDMVDKLVEMWNAKFPDRHINLTYIPHAEMVAKLSRFRLANQRIGFLRFAACADSQGVWHGGKVSGCGER
jgi:hypothetical protein